MFYFAFFYVVVGILSFFVKPLFSYLILLFFCPIHHSFSFFEKTNTANLNESYLSFSLSRFDSICFVCSYFCVVFGPIFSSLCCCFSMITLNVWIEFFIIHFSNFVSMWSVCVYLPSSSTTLLIQSLSFVCNKKKLCSN